MHLPLSVALTALATITAAAAGIHELAVQHNRPLLGSPHSGRARTFALVALLVTIIVAQFTIYLSMHGQASDCPLAG